MTKRQIVISIKTASLEDLHERLCECIEKGYAIQQVIKCDESFITGNNDPFGNYLVVCDLGNLIAKEKKPTLGIMPKKLWDETRYLELCRAISERYNTGQEIQSEWIKEYNELTKTINATEVAVSEGIIK